MERANPLEWLGRQVSEWKAAGTFQRLRELEEAGAQEVIIYLQDAAQLDSVRLFAEECILR